MIEYKCPTCGRELVSQRFIQRHHKFPQTKVNKKYYGKGNKTDGIDWINHYKNIQTTCWHCHVGHSDTRLTIWSEIDFCKALGIEPRSYTAASQWVNMKK